MREPRRTTGRVHAQHNLLSVGCALLIFYGIPLNWNADDSTASRVVGLILFLVGVGGLIWLTWRRLGRLMANPAATGGRVDGVLLLLCVVAMFFAIYYYRLAVSYPDQFDGLVTRTDALYYTVVTLGTVGYGDIHATGQAARIATMVQIVFDLIVIGTLLAIVSSGVTRRLEAAAGEGRAVNGARDTSE
ncbi:potassium channel family protein [Nocardia bovistercoris]|uniref:Two pore domain potassium channel family protein n=1 Tax=Nocardia bovistercoris TaxID=2785916 RepID=A0A931MZJ0_9NOCA|nr:potassium channel family protein [Nocardia bovistercoris]MBH0776195.1 two pore domain potassium channel family protein [Nocardia bovistercoris]